MTPFKTLLAGPPADAHTWNLIYLELLIQENGADVNNLGPNVSFDFLFDNMARSFYDLVVLSCLNGSIKQEGLSLMKERLAYNTGTTQFVIGGALLNDTYAQDVKAQLLQAGFNDVFINETDPSRFISYLNTLKENRREFLSAM